MNNSLRGEIVDILQKVRAGLNVEINKDCEEGADEILALIESKMPEKRNTKELLPIDSEDTDTRVEQAFRLGCNYYREEVKSILRGSDE